MAKQIQQITLHTEQYKRFQELYSLAYGEFLRQNPFIIRDHLPSKYIEEYDSLLEALKCPTQPVDQNK